jgi:hypothetical protein
VTFFLVVDSLWVIILLMFLGGTLVTVRLFRNGAREDADSPAFEALAHAATPPAGRATAAAPAVPDASAQAPAQAKARRRSAAGAAATPRASSRRASTASAPAVWPGGDCPNCASPTVPSAKFCGECGHRLVP